MKLIPIFNKNLFVSVDDDDFERLNTYKWYLVDGYAVRNRYRSELLKPTAVKMHREILGIVNSCAIVDHKNQNRLDNRKENLRLCSYQENSRNRNKFRHKAGKELSSKFKGVSYHKKSKKWIARIIINNKTIHLGCFKDELDAAKAYNNSAILNFKEFAFINNDVQKIDNKQSKK